jgi:RimJ/RimL family protein N-acetyltransferase
MPAVAGARDTDRLRLEPVGPEHADDLWRLHQDDAVAAWHGGRWSVSDAHRNAAAMASAWATDGVGKWIAYDRRTGELVGRGGLSRMGPAEDLTGQIAAALAGDRWARDRLELGWTVRGDRWGRGYATEIGRAGLGLAFDDLGAGEAVRAVRPRSRRLNQVRPGPGGPGVSAVRWSRQSCRMRASSSRRKA